MERVFEVRQDCTVPFDRFCNDGFNRLRLVFLDCFLEGLMDNIDGQIFCCGVIGGI